VRQAVALAPSNGEYRRVLADFLEDAGERRDAAAQYAEAVRLNPGDEYSAEQAQRLGALLDPPGRAGTTEPPHLELRLTPERASVPANSPVNPPR
jgi:hypothetical protein